MAINPVLGGPAISCVVICGYHHNIKSQTNLHSLSPLSRSRVIIYIWPKKSICHHWSSLTKMQNTQPKGHIQQHQHLLGSSRRRRLTMVIWLKCIRVIIIKIIISSNTNVLVIWCHPECRGGRTRRMPQALILCGVQKNKKNFGNHGSCERRSSEERRSSSTAALLLHRLCPLLVPLQ